MTSARREQSGLLEYFTALSAAHCTPKRQGDCFAFFLFSLEAKWAVKRYETLSPSSRSLLESEAVVS